MYCKCYTDIHNPSPLADNQCRRYRLQLKPHHEHNCEVPCQGRPPSTARTQPPLAPLLPLPISSPWGTLKARVMETACNGNSSLETTCTGNGVYLKLRVPLIQTA